MKRLREKMHSRSGASILLALLFLLVCMMVAASILMAAVSNAGKIRSNYEEQQRYMTLSSALRLVAGQMDKAEYTGKCTAYEWEEQIGEDENGDPIMQDYFLVEQTEGVFECGALGNTMSFRDEMDDWFAKEFNKPGFKPRSGLSLDYERTLKVTVEDLEQFQDVTIKAKMDSSTHRVTLTAILPKDHTKPEGEQYIMRAELSAKGDPVVEYNPGTALPSGGPVGASYTTRTPEVKPKVEWTLESITKGKKEAGG